MKQTVEEVAIAFANKCHTANIKGGLDYPYDKLDMRNAFEAGAEWKAKQSPWISVEERLPYYEDDVLALDSRGEVYFYHRSNDAEVITDDIRWCIYHSAPIIAWMPIPSFDEIIKSSKNVIQRLKNR